MAKTKKSIIKQVCQTCFTELEPTLEKSMLNETIMAGSNLFCEWCDEEIKKFNKIINLYKEKQA